MALHFYSTKPSAVAMRKARQARRLAAKEANSVKRFSSLSLEEIAFEAGLLLSAPSSLAWINYELPRAQLSLRRRTDLKGGEGMRTTIQQGAVLAMTAGQKF